MGEGVWFEADVPSGLGQEGLSPVRRRGVKAMGAVRESSAERRWTQRLGQEQQDSYRRRSLVEPGVGSLTGLGGSACRERRLERARRAGWGRLLLGNVALVFLFGSLLSQRLMCPA